MGRCPKKDRPSRDSFFVLPKSATGNVYMDRQLMREREQMVLTIHQGFSAAVKEFDSIALQHCTGEVHVSKMFLHSCLVVHSVSLHF